MTFQKIEQNMNYYRKNKLQTTFTPCQLVKSKQLDTKQTKKTIKKQNSQAIARTKKIKEINKLQKTKIFYGMQKPKTFGGHWINQTYQIK